MAELSSEKEVLRAAIDSPKELPAILDVVRPEDFYSPQLATMFGVVVSSWESGVELDATSLATELERQGKLDQAGGLSAVTDIALRSGLPNWEYHAPIVREKATRRRIIEACTSASQYAAEAPDVPVDEILAKLDKQLAEAQGAESGTVKAIGDTLDATLKHLQEPDTRPRIKTGFRDLDETLSGGLRAGQLVIVAARPGVGKTTLGGDIVRNACIRQGKTALFFSLEMSTEELNARIIAAETETRFSAMQANELSPSEWEHVTNQARKFSDAKIFIDDTPGATMTDIRAKTKMLKQGGLDLVVVDYLQLLTSGKPTESRQQEVAEFSRALKRLAKECEVPIIAVAQLNRGVEQRGEGALPKISDLRESGAIEQDADVVILINRPDYQNPDDARAGEVDFIVAKHRGGPIGTVTAAHQLHYSKFSDPPRPSTPEIGGSFEGF